MSGGSRNYIFLKIEEQLCGQMYDAEINELVKDIAFLAKKVEWFDSSDIGKDDYERYVRQFKEKWFESSREERLKEYIDKKLDETKSELYLLIGEKLNKEE